MKEANRKKLDEIRKKSGIRKKDNKKISIKNIFNKNNSTNKNNTKKSYNNWVKTVQTKNMKDQGKTARYNKNNNKNKNKNNNKTTTNKNKTNIFAQTANRRKGMKEANRKKLDKIRKNSKTIKK